MSLFPFAGTEVKDIAQAIQLSLAPVFLLSGIGVLLTMLANRLARIVDRARPMEEELRRATTVVAADLTDRLGVLARRGRLINRALTLATISALLIAIVVLLVFASTFVHFGLSGPVAVLFILSMLTLCAALIAFLIEVQVATRALRIGPGK